MEEKTELTTVEKQKEEEFSLLLEDLFDEFNKEEVVSVRNFVKYNYKKFKKLLVKVNSGTDRYDSEYIKYINENKGISCKIYNCEDIVNYSKVDLEISFKIFDRRSTSNILFIKGSAPLKGCTEEEADQFMKMVNVIYKSRHGFFRKEFIEE